MMTTFIMMDEKPKILFGKAKHKAKQNNHNKTNKQKTP